MEYGKAYGNLCAVINLCQSIANVDLHSSYEYIIVSSQGAIKSERVFKMGAINLPGMGPRYHNCSFSCSIVAV